MKKILNGPTVWRAKCPCCDCEFEYDVSETFRVYDKSNSSVLGYYNAHLVKPI